MGWVGKEARVGIEEKKDVGNKKDASVKYRLEEGHRWYCIDPKDELRLRNLV